MEQQYDSDDVICRELYWSDWGDEPKIERCSMSGEQCEVLSDISVKWPNGLALDPITDRCVIVGQM